MAEYTLKVRRFAPEDAGGGATGPYWESFDVELDPTLSVLDGLLQAKDRHDGSLSVRCSCRAAICGSCGVKVNGQSTLACLTQIGEAEEGANRLDGGGERNPIVVEPMGNMPVVKDLVTDMESTHWEKVRRVTPWLLDDGDPPERERIVPPESMVDITQTIACIQCGACVSACLSMEADPDFIGPAALAKAYRFVGDPRDVETTERLYDLAQDPHGIYDCTHCFQCIDACPKGVAPMDQIMRLRRAAGEAGIDDRNNGHRHESAFVKIIEKKGTLDESLLLQESYAQGVKGKLIPRLDAIKGLVGSIPTAIRGIRTGKMRSLPKLIPGIHPKLPGDAQEHVKRIYEHAEEHRAELNLYITGEEAEAAEGGAAEESERVAEPAAGDAGGPPDDEMGGAATPSEASAVGGGRQHMTQVTEAGGETAGVGEGDPAGGEGPGDAGEESGGGTSADEPAAPAEDAGSGEGEGEGAGEELAGAGDDPEEEEER